MSKVQTYQYPTQAQRNQIIQKAFALKPLLKTWNPNLSGTPCYKCGLDIDYPGLPPKPCFGCQVPMCTVCQKQPQTSPAVCQDYPLCVGNRQIILADQDSLSTPSMVQQPVFVPPPITQPHHVHIPQTQPIQQSPKDSKDSVVVYMINNPGCINIATTDCTVEKALRFINSFPLENEQFILNNVVLPSRFLNLALESFAPLFSKTRSQYHTIGFDIFYPSDDLFSVPMKSNNGKDVVLQTIDKDVDVLTLNVIANLF